MKKKFILNRSLRGYPVGYKLNLDTNKSGRPLDRYWGSRFDDAKIDNCISLHKEVISEKQSKPVKVSKMFTDAC